MKEIYVEKNFLGAFVPLDEEDGREKVKNGILTVYIDVDNTSIGGELVRIYILDRLMLVPSKDRLEDLANEYLIYVSRLTGTPAQTLKL